LEVLPLFLISLFQPKLKAVPPVMAKIPVRPVRIVNTANIAMRGRGVAGCVRSSIKVFRC
jgi:hypothetical protein